MTHSGQRTPHKTKDGFGTQNSFAMFPHAKRVRSKSTPEKVSVKRGLAVTSCKGRRSRGTLIVDL
eukprot:4745771-Amphidinium_carterae.1